MKKITTLEKILISLGTATLISSCGQGSCFSSTNNDTIITEKLNLTMSAPMYTPAGQEANIPVIVTNHSSLRLENIQYSIPDSFNSTQSQIIITTQSMNSCSTLESGQSCQLVVQTTTGSLPGAFKIDATVSTKQTPTNVIASLLSTTTMASSSVFLGLTSLPSISESGVDGVSMLYPSKMLYNPAIKNNQALITAVVNSDTTNKFNIIDLIDSNSNLLPYSTLSANNGIGTTNYSKGSVVNLALPMSLNNSQLVFFPELKNNSVIVPNGKNNNPEVISIVLPTDKPVAILDSLPSYVNLNEKYISQIITLVNNGNNVATDINIQTGKNIILSNNTCGSTLAVGEACKYTVSMDPKNTKQTAVTTSDTIIYNDGVTQQTTSDIINHIPSNPIAGLIVNSSNINYYFNTTTKTPSYSSIIKLTNNGSSAITLDNWPQIEHFTVSKANTANDCSAQQTIASGASCNILLTYSNDAPTSGSAKFNIGFSYIDENGNTSNDSSDILLVYSTQQALATLITNNNLYDFGNIFANGVESAQQTITLSNIGQTDAQDVTIELANNQSFKIIDNQCGSTLPNGSSCNISVNFGPSEYIADTLNESANLVISYLQASNNKTTQISSQLIGEIVHTNSSAANINTTDKSGFINGDGQINTPFTAEQNATAPSITYTFNNRGSGAANDFYANFESNLIQPWSITTNTCGTAQNPTTLTGNGTANDSCQIALTLDVNNMGSSTLDLSQISFNWVDSSSNNARSTPLANNVIYSVVYPAAKINVVTSQGTPANVGEFQPNANFTITATLSGGYQVKDQTLNLATADQAIKLSTNNCVLNQNTSSCTVNVNLPDSIDSGAKNISISNGGDHGNSILDNTQVAFTVAKYWTNVGINNTYSPNNLDFINLAFDLQSGLPYIVFRDFATGTKAATAMAYDGSNWNYAGARSFTPRQADYLEINFNPNTNSPYIAYKDITGSNNNVSVMQYNGSSWQYVGNPLFSSITVQDVRLSFSPNTVAQPYVALQLSNNQLSVMNFDGASWNQVGTTVGTVNPASTDTELRNIDLIFNPINQQPYVAYIDNSNSDTITVKTYSNGSWNQVGTINAPNAGDVSLAYNPSNQQIYVSFVDLNAGKKANVMSFDGTNWNYVGQNITGATIQYLSMAIDQNGNTYIAYQDADQAQKITVQKYQDGQWVTVGQAGFSTGTAWYTGIKINPLTNLPYVSYRNNDALGAYAAVQYFPYSNAK